MAAQEKMLLPRISLCSVSFLYAAVTLATGIKLQSREAAESGSQASLHRAYTYLEAELNVSAADKHGPVSAVTAHMAEKLVQHKGLQHEVANLLEDSITRGCGLKGSTRHCSHLLSKAKEIVHHQDQLGNTLEVYKDFVKRTAPEVLKWKVRPAHRDHTDKVGVIVLTQGLKDCYLPHNVEYVVRSVAKRLGPEWHLQIFYGNGQQAELAKALGNPGNVTWTRAMVDGEDALGRAAYNRLRWSTDFYGSIDERHEHILIFELDSLLLVENCVGKQEFLKYAMVGAPGGPQFPTHFMNGGFTLRRRSTLLRATGAHSHDDAVKIAGGNPDEDTVAIYNLEAIGADIAPKDVAFKFSLEQFPRMPACGFHKPWIYSQIRPSFFKEFLETATW